MPSMLIRAARFVVALTTLVVAAVHEPDHDRPDHNLTPGVVLEGVSAEQVCRPGYAAAVRHVPESTRRAAFAVYGLGGNHTGYCAGPQGCELDHLISLELGGSNDLANLWPQSYDSQPWNARRKDRLENRLHALVCSGRLPLEQAQRAIATDWIAAYRLHVEAVDPPAPGRRRGAQTAPSARRAAIDAASWPSSARTSSL